MSDFHAVKNCWTKIKKEKNVDLLVDKFYQTLFSHLPDTRNLFPADLVSQKRSLLSTLDNVINGLEYIDSIKSELVDLGRHHKNIGITKEMYDVFVITILDAADYASNATLTDQERNAWKNAFRKVSDIMLEAY